jgi:hypothetical protein
MVTPTSSERRSTAQQAIEARLTTGSESLVGYVTADDNYSWICQPCLEDLNDQFQWNVVSAPTDP